MGRMNKIFLPVIAIQFAVIMILLFDPSEINNITPISRLDIVPVIKGSVGPSGIGVYLFYAFMIGNKIQNEKNFGKKLIFPIAFIFTATTILLIVLLMVFGSGTLVHFPFPLLIAVKQMFKTQSFSGLEALFLSLWFLADFITVTFFSYLVLVLLKYLFGLKNPIPLLSIIMVFSFFMSSFISNEIFELEYFIENIGLQVNIILGFILPLILWIVAKIRKMV